MSDIESWAGRRVLVTGGASGLGRATVGIFLERGAEVIALDRDQQGLAEVAKAAPSGSTLVTLSCNVADADDVKRVFADVGPLDAAANVAAIGQQPIPIEQADPETFDRIMAVNVRGIFLCMQQELALIRPHGRGGSIVNVSSSGGLTGAPYVHAYIAAKHAVVGLTRSVAVEVAKEGIRVNAVCPGLMDTPMFRASNFTQEQLDQMLQMKPIGRFAQPEEVAEAIVWLSGKRASFMVGAAVAVDGGVTAV
jgi:NAD(P)-dependent dehydrogenase (short-subunit alcohol dehydrogenase family)